MLLMLIAFLDREGFFRLPALMPMGGAEPIFMANIQKAYGFGKRILINVAIVCS
jgi:hypothetical protein